MAIGHRLAIAVAIGWQARALSRGTDVIVATPGRLLDLCRSGALTLERTDIFVLDGADRMLDMGFIHDVRRIAAMLRKKRQTLLFSATMSAAVSRVAEEMLSDSFNGEFGRGIGRRIVGRSDRGHRPQIESMTGDVRPPTHVRRW
jgi:superfamily II DNA/RNA helicase